MTEFKTQKPDYANLKQMTFRELREHLNNLGDRWLDYPAVAAHHETKEPMGIVCSTITGSELTSKTGQMVNPREPILVCK